VERQLRGLTALVSQLEAVSGINSIRLKKAGIHLYGGYEFNACRVARAFGTVDRFTRFHLLNVTNYTVLIQVSDIQRDECLVHPEAVIRALLFLVLKQHARIGCEGFSAHQAFLALLWRLRELQADVDCPGTRREAPCNDRQAG